MFTFSDNICTFIQVSMVLMFVLVRPYFGLPESFPSNQLLVRTYTGKKRNIYLASRLVKELTKRNEHILKVTYHKLENILRCGGVFNSLG